MLWFPQCFPTEAVDRDKNGTDGKNLIEHTAQRACECTVNKPAGTNTHQAGYSNGSGIIGPESDGADN
jgi:hypothetical protein